jgi:dimethylglycine oxidase
MVEAHMAHSRVVIVGAGIVGCALADELTERGWHDVTVVDQGPLFTTGGSTSHAPGLVFQTNPSKTMTEFARYTVRKYAALSVDGTPCFGQVGGLEVATTAQRWADLARKVGFATSWGVDARLVTPQECADLHSLLDPDRIYGGMYVPTDGLARPTLTAEAQARRAAARGARFLERHEVVGISRAGGRVTGIETTQGPVEADIVVICAGFWGPRLGAMAGLTVPLLPLAHQYARTAPLPALRTQSTLHEPHDADLGARRPILRHQDRDLYFREHGDRLGIGSYAHRPMPVQPGDAARGAPGPGPGNGPGGAPGDVPNGALDLSPSMLPFTEDDFAPSWQAAQDLIPDLADSKIEDGFNGIFSFTPDGFPIMGESRDTRGLWVAEAVWITHSAGVARAVADWLVDGQPGVDVHECDLHRFEDVHLSPAYVHERGCQNFVEVYDIIHPLQPMESPRPLRTSPFHPRQRDLGAYFLENAGWERPHWYDVNEPLTAGLEIPTRDEWSARYWSPIAAAEARATRERVALYDMTPLKRLAVTGPGAETFLQHLTTNNVARTPGAVSYTLLLDESGGIRSDLTVARLGEAEFQVGANGQLDLDWLLRHAPQDGSVQVRDITAGTCCVGVWGPRARDLVQPLTADDFSHQGFGYFRAKRAFVGNVPVTAMRVSYVGELGWELYTTADLGLKLWDTLWEAGQPLGVVAAGRSAFNSLRLEKGYRAWGVDVTPEHTPAEAGLEFAVRMDKGDFVGRAAISGQSAEHVKRRLTALVFDDRRHVVMGKEPVYIGGVAAGYVTSAAYGYSLDASIAYAWLPAEASTPGTRVDVEYFGERLPATVHAEPLFDPAMERIRC